MSKTNDKKDILDKQVENFQYATALIKIILGFLAIGIFLFSKHAFIFFSAAVLPSIVIIFIDTADHKCLSATTCTFNLIGIIPFLKELYISQSPHLASKNIITTPTSWLVVYATTLIGLAIYMSLPSIIAQIYIAKANMRISTLITYRKKICSEWDIKLEDLKQDDILKKMDR